MLRILEVKLVLETEDSSRGTNILKEVSGLGDKNHHFLSQLSG